MESKLESKEYQIAGMTCGHCVMAVRTALERLDGVRVDAVEIGRAKVAFEPDVVAEALVRDAITDAGYEVKGTA